MLNEVVIGLDPHKVSNTIVVLERDETLLTRRRFVHDDDGLVAMFAAVAEFPKRVWAVEGANGMGRSIAQRLVAAGETVIDVPAMLSTRVRVYSTGHGTKTDHTDAVAIARAAIHSKHLADQMRVELATELIDDGASLDLKIDQITKRINATVNASGTTLTRVYGVGPINAALILGEIEALRCLKRRVTDAAWCQRQVDRQDDQTQDDTWPRRPSTRQGEPSYRSRATPRMNGNPMRPRPAKV